jgi:hypothetical protein
MATSLSILISDTSGCVIFRRLSIAPVSGQPWEDFQLNHLVLAFLVAARFADPLVSLQLINSPETGWEDKDMSGLYDKIREDVSFRREWAEKAGLGFEIPTKHFAKNRVIGRNGRKRTERPDVRFVTTV